MTFSVLCIAKVIIETFENKSDSFPLIIGDTIMKLKQIFWLYLHLSDYWTTAGISIRMSLSIDNVKHCGVQNWLSLHVNTILNIKQKCLHFLSLNFNSDVFCQISMSSSSRVSSLKQTTVVTYCEENCDVAGTLNCHFKLNWPNLLNPQGFWLIRCVNFSYKILQMVNTDLNETKTHSKLWPLEIRLNWSRYNIIFDTWYSKGTCPIIEVICFLKSNA